MAAKLGVSPTGWENRGNDSAVKPAQERELHALMEKLRCRSTQLKNWTESINAVHSAVMNDKRVQSDALQRSGIQTCVDRLQRAIKVVNKHTLIERLDSITRQLGLTLTPPTGSENSAFINTDMFYIEIVLDKEVVKDVKICHQGDPVSCEELIEVLSKGNFDEFVSHLQGLLDMYKIPGDKKQKSKAFLALHSLETDLNDLAQLQSSINGVANYIHKSPLGILLPRKGGFPMKLIYFVSPYDLLDKKTKSPHPMTVEAIIEHDLGQSVTICIEQYAPNRLQTIPLMSEHIREDGKSLPSFQGLSNVNSAELPASFVLVLPQPVPVALSVVRAIQNVTNLDVITASETKTLLNLILEKTANGKVCDDSQFYVTLPDQQHVYFIRDVNGNSLDQPAVMVSHIPFTHPTNVAQVLNHLRQQLLFNTVVGSCIRPYANQSRRSSVVFDLSAVSLQHFTIMFEHPLQDAMVTAELDLSDITNVKFKVSIDDEGEFMCSDDTASKIFQRCLSIPVTLRSVIFKVSEQLRKEPSPEPLPIPVEMDKPRHWFSNMANYSPGHVIPDSQISMYPGMVPHGPPKPPPAIASQVPNPGGGLPFVEPSNMVPITDQDKEEKPQSNPLLATLLDQNSPSPEPPPVNESPMLSKLLEDTTSLASRPPAPPVTKAKRGPKRKSSRTDSSGTSPSSKHHRLSEGESNNNNNYSEMESNSFDHDMQHPNAMRHSSGPTSTIIDLTEADPLSTESHVKKLENTMDSYISKQNRSFSQDSDNMAFMLSDMEHINEMENTRNYYSAVPKNEKTSTSLEELLGRSGEVLKTTDLNAYAKQMNSIDEESSTNTYNSFSRQNSNQSAHSQLSAEVINGGHSNVGGKFTPSFSDSEASGGSASTTPTKSCDTSALVPCAMLGSRMAANQSVVNTDLKPEIKVEKYEGQDLKSLLLAGRKDKNSESKASLDDFKNVKVKKEGNLKLKLPTSGLRHLDRTNSSPSELLDIRCRRNKSKEEMFEFESDDDEPFLLPINVSSSPPIRLQISNKNKNSRIYDPKRIKVEKFKKKESKHSDSSGDSGKRKREKYDSKKEKKKKKLGDTYKSTSLDESAVYSLSTTVESDGFDLKPNMKLKIIKSGIRLETSSPKTASPSNRDKVESSRKSVKEHSVKHSSSESALKDKSSSQKSASHKSHRSSSVSSGVNKSDSKLMKTPTIKLKPITLPNSASVNVSGAKTPTSSSTPTSASPTIQGKTGLTPTSTTIGRMGAVTMATSGVPKSNVSQASPSGKATTPTTPQSGKNFTSVTPSSGKVTTPPVTPSSGKVTTPTVTPSSGKVTPTVILSSGKVTTPTSAKTPPGFNKGSVSPIYSSKSSSVSTTSGKTIVSHSGKSSMATGRSSSVSGSGKSSSGKVYSGDRKSGSPSVSGGRNTPVLSKSNSSHNKSPLSTSSAGSKNQPSNHYSSAASVLSFLNTNASGIASLPPIPKLSSASSGNTNSNKSNASTNSSVSNSQSAPPSKPHQSPMGGSSNPQNKMANNPGHVTGTSSKSSSLTSNSAYTTNRPNPVSRSNSAGGVSNRQGFVKTAGNVSISSQSKSESANPSSTSKIETGSATNPNKQDSSSSTSRSGQNTLNSAQNKTHSASNVTSDSESNKKVMASEVSGGGTAAKVKARKGSLSAIVDKLHVKQISGSGPSNAGGSSTEKETSRSQQEVELQKEGTCTSSSDSSFEEGSHSEKVENSGEKASVQHSQTSHDVNNVQNHKQRSDISNNANSAKSGNIHVGKFIETENNKKVGSHTETVSAAKPSPSKDNKNENRNLFTSILLSASGKKITADDGEKTKNGQVTSSSEREEQISKKAQSKGKTDESSRSPTKRPRTQSPSQNLNKVNGETNEMMSKKTDLNRDMFKVPTPKSQQVEEKDMEDTENLVVRKKPRSHSNSRPVLSPSSPISSPENLIIDCQTMSPRTLQNKTNSPKIHEISVDNQADNKRVSVSVNKKSLTPSPKCKNSPLPSPVLSSKEHLNPGSISNPSPSCEIDDDLMDEALLGLTS